MLQQNQIVYPPNKEFEREIEFSKIPVIYDHFLFIDINKHGESIVGCSSLNNTLWEGTLAYFSNQDDLQALKFDKSYVGSTVSDGKFLNENTIVLAEDTGIINVIKISESNLISTCYFKEADRISKLATWNKSTKVLTCSGNNVTVWDVNLPGTKPSHHYADYHTQQVNYVDTLKKEPNIFVSASTDRKCCIWDTRDSSPAQILYTNEFSSLTSVACNQMNDNYIVIGTEVGDIYLVDKREPKEFISVANCNCYVHRILFDDSNKVAVCGDNNKVLVFKCEEEILNNAYCNDKHNGMVRGLAWYNETLYSCGFDRQIVKHLF